MAARTRSASCRSARPTMAGPGRSSTTSATAGSRTLPTTGNPPADLLEQEPLLEDRLLDERPDLLADRGVVGETLGDRLAARHDPVRVSARDRVAELLRARRELREGLAVQRRDRLGACVD